LLAATIIVSRKFVSMGRKSCLFVYYVKLINIELWMAEEATPLNDGLESRMVECKIRRKIQKQCRHVFLLSSSVSRASKFDLF
jgi:hypothetical protein